MKPWPTVQMSAGVTNEEWKMIKNYVQGNMMSNNKPLWMRSPGWYIDNEPTFEIRGGPHCEYSEEFYRKGDKVFDSIYPSV